MAVTTSGPGSHARGPHRTHDLEVLLLPIAILLVLLGLIALALVWPGLVTAG